MDHQAEQLSDLQRAYRSSLETFLGSQSEQSLYDASQVALQFIQRGVGPEEMVAIHTESLERLLAVTPPLDATRRITQSFQFLIEMMIAYGVRYKDYLDLRMREQASRLERDAEIERLRVAEQVRLQGEAIKEREAFLSFVAHELRNPLTVLIGNIDYLVTSSRATEPARQARIFANLRTASQRLQEIITNMLVMSRVQRSASVASLSSVSLGKIVQDATDEVVLQATDRRTEMDVQIPTPPPVVKGDGAALTRVFINLLDNAIKYTPMGGRVWIRVYQDGDMVYVEIGDTGQGIAETELPHLFDPYYRGFADATPFAKGFGLGLALVKMIVDQHGGSIRVTSRVGSGTVFTVALQASP
jgi:signal transduction histidine kinase